MGGISKERISGTPQAKAAVTHQMLTSSSTTAVTLLRAAINICILKYLSTNIQGLIWFFPISVI